MISIVDHHDDSCWLAHSWMLGLFWPKIWSSDQVQEANCFGCQILTEEKAERPCSECSERSRSQKRVEAQPRHEKGETELYADLVGLELVPAISCCFTWDGWPPTPFAPVFSVTIQLKIKGLLRHQWTNQKLISTSMSTAIPQLPSAQDIQATSVFEFSTEIRQRRGLLTGQLGVVSSCKVKSMKTKGERSHATTHASKISRNKFHEISWNLNNT